MNIILVALLIIIAIASIAALVWFLDAKFNSLYARLNDLQMPGNGLEEPSQDQSASPPSVSWQETESQLNVSFSPSILAGPSKNYGCCRINSTLKTDTEKPEAPESESKPCAQKASLEWAVGRAYKTREGKRVVLNEIANGFIFSCLFSDGFCRTVDGMRSEGGKSPLDIIDYWPDDVTAPIAETEEARDMAGAAPVSLYEKRATSTYWKRKSDGVCAHCGKTPAKAGRVLCAKCNRTNNIRQRARYKERIESGE